MGAAAAVACKAGERRNVNREPTDLDPMADLVINAEIGDVPGHATGAN